MFPQYARVGVAVSGGADSVLLLHVLRELAPCWGLRLFVLHLNHNLRGEESRQDAAFVVRMAAELGIETRIEDVMLETTGNLEENARDARLDFYRRAGMDRIAVGHT